MEHVQGDVSLMQKKTPQKFFGAAEITHCMQQSFSTLKYCRPWRATAGRIGLCCPGRYGKENNSRIVYVLHWTMRSNHCWISVPSHISYMENLPGAVSAGQRGITNLIYTQAKPGYSPRVVEQIKKKCPV